MTRTVPTIPFGTSLRIPGLVTPTSGAPTPLGRPPLGPHPSQIPPLAGGESSASAAQSQGGSPFGALPPPTLLVPVLLLGAVLLAREKTPLLIVDMRYSPPG
jgi:hypothetical protein